MNNIALPQKIKYEKTKNPNQGSMIIEPCYPGYGITLGNALRRVLLSSLLGAAPVGAKIKGVNHEFMAVPHLKEDILEFILNLKRLRLKIFSDEPVKLELDIHGEKEIRAADIKKDSAVEIVNPDLILGHITDMSGSLNVEIFVSGGMGYETIESREKQEKEIGYIEMDAIFSPVLSAGIKVENVRVGKMTNWDKLILDITTDCTITPQEAFGQAVKILIKQCGALVEGMTDEDKKVNEEAGGGKKAEDSEDSEENKKTKIRLGVIPSTRDDHANKKGGQENKAEEDEDGDDQENKDEKVEKDVKEDEQEEKPKRKRGRPRKS